MLALASMLPWSAAQEGGAGAPGASVPARTEAAPAAPVYDLERIDDVIRGGALELAAVLLERYQPQPPGSEPWLRWEERLLHVYALQSRWAAIAARGGSLPAELPATARASLRTRVAEALVEAGEGEAARRVLRELLWRSGMGGADAAAWRRMVVRSYLADDLLEDARAALLRFDIEYRPDDPAWRHLHARALLRAGYPDAAAERVAAMQTTEGKSLLLLARLRSAAYTPNQVIDGALALANDDAVEVEPRLRREIWATIAAAAGAATNLTLRAEALERALDLAAPAQGARDLVAVDVDALWSAYLALAQDVGNAAGLLIGDHEPWLRRADELREEYPAAARAVYALLTSTDDDAMWSAAHGKLVEALLGAELEGVVAALYGPDARFGYAAIPAATRLRLSQAAYEAGDVGRAARLVADLLEPPAGQTPFEWTLRRARLSIFAAQFDDAEAMLQGLVASVDEFEEADADRLLQLVFDLQGAGRHEAAIGTLRALHERLRVPRQRRETLLWLADSYSARGEFDIAAELYLRSALLGSDGFDKWGQAARFQAAKALAKLGLVEDSRRLLEALLVATDDPRRRALIEQELQGLWLVEAGPGRP